MTNIESSALNQFLSEYPLEWNYEAVIMGISEDEDEVIVWDVLQGESADYIIELIENLKKDMTNLVRLAKLADTYRERGITWAKR